MGSGIFKLCQFNRSCDERVFWRIAYENARAVYCRLKYRYMATPAPVKTGKKPRASAGGSPLLRDYHPSVKIVDSILGTS
ncbi:hypothetical protein Pan258_38180 [Symmachiella dynata]|nr:hypothetical protein Pan258_38180 [Symmachiella dynata]